MKEYSSVRVIIGDRQVEVIFLGEELWNETILQYKILELIHKAYEMESEKWYRTQKFTAELQEFIFKHWPSDAYHKQLLWDFMNKKNETK